MRRVLTHESRGAGLIVLGLTLLAALAAAQPDPGGRRTCKADSFCGEDPCQVIPGGPIDTCNCCSNSGLNDWTCCDNVPCTECIINP